MITSHEVFRLGRAQSYTRREDLRTYRFRFKPIETNSSMEEILWTAILAVGLDQGPEAMAQGVPAYWIGDLQVCESWLDVDPINAAWPVGFPRACEFHYFQPPPRAA